MKFMGMLKWRELKMKRDIRFAVLLLLSIVFGCVSISVALAFLEDVSLSCPLWAGILVLPSFGALFVGLFVVLSGLAFYAGELRLRDLLPLGISGASLLVLCAILVLWFSYPFSNSFPMP